VIVADAGPLWTFAVADALDLLAMRLSGRVAWTTAVHREIERNCASVPELKEVLAAPWLPEPVDLATLGMAEEALHLRDRFADPGDHRLKHLGEAESIVYARHKGADTFLTQDGAAAERARFEQIRTLWVDEVLCELVAFGDAPVTEVWTIAQRMQAAERLPLSFTRSELLR
jgi:predicted nucleic acid-binding protein